MLAKLHTLLDTKDLKEEASVFRYVDLGLLPRRGHLMCSAGMELLVDEMWWELDDEQMVCIFLDCPKFSNEQDLVRAALKFRNCGWVIEYLLLPASRDREGVLADIKCSISFRSDKPSRPLTDLSLGELQSALEDTIAAVGPRGRSACAIRRAIELKQLEPTP